MTNTLRFVRPLLTVLVVGLGLALAPIPVYAQAPVAQTERRVPSLDVSSASAAQSTQTRLQGPAEPAMLAEVPGRGHALERGLERFHMIAVSVHGPDTDVLVRTANAGRWSDWTPLHLDTDHAPDRGSSELALAPHGLASSEPLWVGGADGYEVSAPPEARGLVVDLVRDRLQTVRMDATSAGAAVAPPAIRPRSSWGARAPKETPIIAGDFRLAVIHHSVTTNSYSASDVPAIIRGIQAYHMDGRGWNDIAYNFVVDRFGVVWEGRAGGIDKAVIGGHAQGFNTYSTGVVALGDFTSATPPAAVSSAISQLLAWKFAVHRLNPNGWTEYTTAGSSSLAAGTYRFNRIIGHRDVGQTACPGGQLYAQLPSIRSGAISGFAGHLDSLPAIPLTGDFNGDAAADTLFYRQGTQADLIWYGRGARGFTRVSMPVSGVYRPLVGDFNGDEIDDILWHGPGSDLDSVMYGRVGGGFSKKVLDIPGSYAPFTGDFNGDDVDDIFWYGPGTGPDRLHFGTRSSSFVPRAVAVDTNYIPVVGDFNGDGPSDVLWYTPNSGPDRYWYGRPTLGEWGRPASPTISGSYWPVVDDYSADGLADIFWFGPGSVADSFWWGTTREGSLRSQSVVATTSGSPTAFDGAGDGAADILWYLPGTGGDPYWRLAPGGTVIAQTTLTINGSYLQAAGDYDADGRDDLLWWTPNGQVHVWYGQVDGGFTRLQVA